MTIFIVNPNSSQTVTDGIDRTVEPMRGVSPVPITCRTLAEGPKGIETQAHVDGVVAPLLAHCAALEDQASVFVVACFSDPGLAALREQSARPVLGIAESAVLTGLARGDRFGMISIRVQSMPRHTGECGAMGGMDRRGGAVRRGRGVAELADKARTFARLKTVGAALRDDKGADVLILGCAGMTAFRADLEVELGRPVVEPCQAAAAMAVGRLALARAEGKGTQA